MMNDEALIEKIKGWRKKPVHWQLSHEEGYTFFASIDGEEVRLRLNRDFPAEPICSVIVGDREFDIEEIPGKWELPPRTLV